MAISSEKLDLILQNFASNNNNVEAVAIVSANVLIATTHLPNSLDKECILAICAQMLSLSKRIEFELFTGKVEKFYVEGSNGYLFLTSCGEEAVLLVLAKKSAEPGRLTLEIKQTTTEIKNILTSEDLVENLKEFFAEDLVEDLKDFLLEDLLLPANLKNSQSRWEAQEVVGDRDAITSRKPDVIPAWNGKLSPASEE